MSLIETLSLIAGLMTASGPIFQVIKTVRTKDVSGLSMATYLLLLTIGSFGVLFGLQYHVFFILFFNGLVLAGNTIVLWMVSRRAVIGFYGTLAILVAIAWLLAPWFLRDVLSTVWAEEIGSIYGVIAATTFLPQVLYTRRTRVVSSLAAPNFLLTGTGLVVWVSTAFLLHNWSFIFWNSILALGNFEILRMKIIYGRDPVQATGKPLASH